jgi:hypothetical protein
MIDKLILHNFQSHADSVFDFSEGITSIIGESDSGKTASFRSFEGIRKNRQFGLENASHWITNVSDSGEISLMGIMSATVVLSDGKYITRERDGEGFNGYRIGEYEKGKFLISQEFNKVGTSVPFPVRDLLNMDDVNIQNQHDTMFLLSETGQDVARYFNRLIKLDVSVTALASSERRKRAAKKEVTTIKTEIQELNEAAKKLNWVDAASATADRINTTESKIVEIEDALETLDTLVENIISVEKKCSLPEYHEQAEMLFVKIDILNEKISVTDDKIYNITVIQQDIIKIHKKVFDASWIEGTEAIMKKIDSVVSEIIETKMNIIKINDFLSSIADCESNLKESDYNQSALETVERILKINTLIAKKSEGMDDIEIMIKKMNVCDDKITAGMSSIAALQAKMPDKCPTCGRPLEVVA